MILHFCIFLASKSVFEMSKGVKEEIDKQIKGIENGENNDLLEIKYLYFDNYD